MKLKELFFKGWFLASLAFVSGIAVAQFSYIGNDTILSEPDGQLVFQTQAAKDVVIRTGVGVGTPNEFLVDHSTADVVLPGNVDLTASGKTLILEDGTAASSCIGTATANGTTAVTVSTTCVQTGDYIFISANAADVNTANCWATNIVDATSFDLDCDAASTTTFNWVIIKGQ